MYYYQKVDDTVLVDLLALHTTQLTNIKISGETYKGEYSSCKMATELLQVEFIYRHPSSYFPMPIFRSYINKSQAEEKYA